MTKIAITQDGIFKALKVNGRTVSYAGNISSIEQVSAGRWEGEAGGEPFTIVGGRASGGASNEWWVKWEPAYGDEYLRATSAVQAVNFIERA